MNHNAHPPLYRSRRPRRNWRAIIVAAAAIILTASMLALSYDWDSYLRGF